MEFLDGGQEDVDVPRRWQVLNPHMGSTEALCSGYPHSPQASPDLNSS